jgi:hypothetical protein
LRPCRLRRCRLRRCGLRRCGLRRILGRLQRRVLKLRGNVSLGKGDSYGGCPDQQRAFHCFVISPGAIYRYRRLRAEKENRWPFLDVDAFAGANFFPAKGRLLAEETMLDPTPSAVDVIPSRAAILWRPRRLELIDVERLRRWLHLRAGDRAFCAASARGRISVVGEGA